MVVQLVIRGTPPTLGDAMSFLPIDAEDLKAFDDMKGTCYIMDGQSPWQPNNPNHFHHRNTRTTLTPLISNSLNTPNTHNSLDNRTTPNDLKC